MRRVVALVADLATAAGLAGCATMPEQGPVVEAPSGSLTTSDQEPPSFDPLPPQEGATRPEIVRGFLNAMRATPIETRTAREFLSEDAASVWSPQDETITYESAPSPRDEGDDPDGAGGDVSISLANPNHLDSRGAWKGPLPPLQRTINFPMTLEGGEWRIAAAPNAMIVPEDWFTGLHRQVSVYFFDPTASILVPEPVFVPRGDQLASSLTQALLKGPGPGLDRVEQSFVPPGLEVAVGVTINDGGVADILLTGDPGRLSSQSIELMAAQFAWTLRQEPDVESFRISIDGEPVPLPGGASTYRIDGGYQYDPAVFEASQLLYGLSRGLLVEGTASALAPTEGPMGTGDYGLRSVGVSIRADSVAGVTEDGTSVLTAPVAEPGAGKVRTLATGTDLLRPAWDFADRTWLVDRTANGARVSYVDGPGSEPRNLRVPGITGQRVQMFLVSRDGTRLIAVVRRPVGDVVRVSRIEHAASGRVIGASRAERIAVGDGGDVPVRAIGWRSGTSLVVLHELARSLSEVTPGSVDGAPMSPDIAVTAIDGRLLGLAGSPVTDEVTYGVTRDGLVEVSTSERSIVPFEQRPTVSVVYAG